MNFTGENVFSGADLSKPEGGLLFAEGNPPSQHLNDITLTLALSGGGKKLKAPATIKLTSVELTLDIANAPLPGQPLKPLPMPDKQTVGARVFVQSTRAVLIVGQPKPSDLNHELTLSTLSGCVELLARATASKGGTPLSGVLKIKSGTIPPAGKPFFIEGRFPSKNVTHETYALGIGTGVMGRRWKIRIPPRPRTSLRLYSYPPRAQGFEGRPRPRSSGQRLLYPRQPA